MTPYCKNCRFWRVDSFHSTGEVGTCRKVQNGSNEWPVVDVYEWCGEHEPLPDGAASRWIHKREIWNPPFGASVELADDPKGPIIWSGTYGDVGRADEWDWWRLADDTPTETSPAGASDREKLNPGGA